jgi:hypothetical protein
MQWNRIKISVHSLEENVGISMNDQINSIHYISGVHNKSKLINFFIIMKCTVVCNGYLPLDLVLSVPPGG